MTIDWGNIYAELLKAWTPAIILSSIITSGVTSILVPAAVALRRTINLD